VFANTWTSAILVELIGMASFQPWEGQTRLTRFGWISYPKLCTTIPICKCLVSFLHVHPHSDIASQIVRIRHLRRTQKRCPRSHCRIPFNLWQRKLHVDCWAKDKRIVFAHDSR
jgi:hypothetical protein